MIAPRIDYDGRHLVASHGSHVPRRIVLHDTESHDVKGIRDLAGIATYWNGVNWGPGSQIGVDEEGYAARYVDDNEIAYHVENHNTGSLGIEQIGFATFSFRTWKSRPAQLETVSRWLAWWGLQYGIPLKLDVEHGVSTHAMQSAAYHGTHTDPGRGYPLDDVLDRGLKLQATLRPSPKPKSAYTEDAFWLWLRWRLGEGEFKRFGPRSTGHRPESVPELVPGGWWKRAEAFVARRAASQVRGSVAA